MNLTIKDVLSSLENIDEDNIVINNLKQDVWNRVKYPDDSDNLVPALLTVLEYYMPSSDYQSFCLEVHRGL